MGLVPYELRHERHLAAIALSELEWPRQDPPSEGCIGDLAAEDHIVIHSYIILFRKLRCSDTMSNYFGTPNI